MIKKIIQHKLYLMILCLVFSALTAAFADNPIDLSEKLLKINEPVLFHRLGEDGFSIFDGGEKKLKFFTWNFEVNKTMPLSIGEGPGEIKQSVLAACVVNGQTYLLGVLEKKINVYGKDGLFVKTIKLDFLPKTMVFSQGKLYLFNIGFSAKKASPLLARIIDPNANDSSTDIILNDDLELGKVFSGNPALLGLSSMFDVGDNKNIYLLISAAGVLFEIDKNGKLVAKEKLPYEERIVFRTVKEGNEEQKVMSVLDWYQDMKVVGNTVYTCFLKHQGKDEKTGIDIYRTHVLKSLGSGKFAEKAFDGNFVIIGEHEKNLYLFNTGDYQALAVKMDEWVN